MGRVGAPFGVKGWVHVQPYSEMDDALADHAVWQVGRSGMWADYALEEFRPQGNKMVAKLVGVDDRDAAFALRGSEIAVPRTSLPPAGLNEYYWSDLVGLEVVTAQGVTVLVDRRASLFLIGTVMDYETKALTSGFTFTNPNEKGRCGCGESFHV